MKAKDKDQRVNKILEDNEVVVRSFYRETYNVSNFAFSPKISGMSHSFMFENFEITIFLPEHPDNIDPKYIDRHPARITGWMKGTPYEMSVGAISLVIDNLDVAIPAAAAAKSHIDMSLYSEKQRKRLDPFSDNLHLLSKRAIEHWLRILWWKTKFPLVGTVTPISSNSSDGGALINAQNNTRYYTPRIGRTYVVPAIHIVSPDEWDSIQIALKLEKSPPIWSEFLASAFQRNDLGDHTASFLDLAIAIETFIRAAIFNAIPANTPRPMIKSIERMRISDIIRDWERFNFTHFPEKKHIEMVFKIRDSIMHKGETAKSERSKFKILAKTASTLLRSIPDP